MELVRWKPAREIFSLQHKMNDFFNDCFFPMETGGTVWPAGDWNPKVDIYEDADHIFLSAELPGVDKKDIEVGIKNGVLTLKGERSADNEVKEKDYYRRERSFGRFERSFSLQGTVDATKIKAEHKDGVLKVSIPKPEEIKPKQITVH